MKFEIFADIVNIFMSSYLQMPNADRMPASGLTKFKAYNYNIIIKKKKKKKNYGSHCKVQPKKLPQSSNNSVKV